MIPDGIDDQVSQLFHMLRVAPFGVRRHFESPVARNTYAAGCIDRQGMRSRQCADVSEQRSVGVIAVPVREEADNCLVIRLARTFGYSQERLDLRSEYEASSRSGVIERLNSQPI